MREQVVTDAEEVSPAETARRLGIGLGQVYVLLWSSKLAARKVNGQWMVSAVAIAKRLKAKQQGETR